MSVRFGDRIRFIGAAGAFALVASLGTNAHASELDQALDEISPDPSAKAKSADDSSEEAEEMSLDDVEVSGQGERVAQAGTPQGNRARREAREERADEVEEEVEDNGLAARLPWRGSAFSWGHSASPSILGIGDDTQGRDFETYTQTFSVGLNYFFIDQDQWSLAVATSPSVSVELTDSAVTTTRNEPQFNDLPVSLAYRRRLHTDADVGLATGLVLNGTVIAPTSPASQANSTYLRTSPRVVLWQVLPLLGRDAPALRSIILGGSFRWDHRFGEATTPVGGRNGFVREFQGLNNNIFPSDQFSFGRLRQNTLRQGLFAFFSESHGNQLVQAFASFSFTQEYVPEFSNQCISLDTGLACTEDTSFAEGTQTNDSAQDAFFGYGFAVGMSYFPMPEWGISVNYSNVGGQLGLDGQRQSIAYNPRSAQFGASIAIGFDAIYEAITGPRRAGAFFLVAQNEEKKKERNDERREEESSPIEAAGTL